MDEEYLRLECLKLSVKQIGPWNNGEFKNHQINILSLALMYHVFCTEGYIKAKEMAENNVRPDSAEIIKLVKEEEYDKA